MYAIKDRISEKLSRLFSDSPSHVVDQQPQARPYSKEGRSLSAVFSFILPSLSFNKTTSDGCSDGSYPTKSNSFNWRSKSFTWREKPLDRNLDFDHEYEHKEAHEDNGFSRSSAQEIPDSARSCACGSEVFEDASDSQYFGKSMPNLMEDSFFMNPDLYEFFESSLPNIVKGCQWVLLYSTVKHGISLRTLIRKSGELTGPCLLIVGDKQGAIFGGLLECPLNPTAKRKYQGTNQTFVFTTMYGEPRLFRPTGANRYYYLCMNDLLAIGGGGNFALRMDGDLLNGTSGPCETFGNLCLAHDQDFELKNVELWGFKHASRYLT